MMLHPTIYLHDIHGTEMDHSLGGFWYPWERCPRKHEVVCETYRTSNLHVPEVGKKVPLHLHSF